MGRAGRVLQIPDLFLYKRWVPFRFFWSHGQAQPSCLLFVGL